MLNGVDTEFFLLIITSFYFYPAFAVIAIEACVWVWTHVTGGYRKQRYASLSACAAKACLIIIAIGLAGSTLDPRQADQDVAVLLIVLTLFLIRFVDDAVRTAKEPHQRLQLGKAYRFLGRIAVIIPAVFLCALFIQMQSETAHTTTPIIGSESRTFSPSRDIPGPPASSCVSRQARENYTLQVIQAAEAHLGFDKSRHVYWFTPLERLGADALDEVEIRMALEKKYDVKIHSPRGLSSNTIGELVTIIEDAQCAKERQDARSK